MAATNPFRTSDLIAKYGWKVMPYLSNLGPQLLAEAQVLFVDSGHTNALDADNTEHGHSFEKPLATIDYAIGLCTAAERSVILVAPGHNDPLGDAQIDFDVSDITVIGIGEGSNKPTINFDHANSSVDIGANNIHLINLRFLPSITDVLIGVDIETLITGTILEKCDFAEGEDGDADEFVVSVALKEGCTNTKITNCLFRSVIDAAGCTAAVKLTGVSDNVIIEKSRFIGNWSTAAVHNDSGACTDLLVDDCTMKVKDGEPGIEVVGTTTGIIRNVCIESSTLAVDSMIVAADMSWFNNYGVTSDGSAAEIIGGGEVNAQMVAHGLDHLVTLADGTDAYPASVVEDSILAKLISKDEPPVTTSFDNTKHSLEAISDKIGASGGGIAYFVDNDNGDNANDGLGWDTAKADIDHAIGSVNGVVSDYDVVYVRGTATFEESVSTGVVTGVKLIGVGDGKINPLWTSAANGESALIINGQGFELHNFLFHGAGKTAAVVVVQNGGDSTASGTLIKNCYFHGGGTSNFAIHYDGASLQNKLIGNHITGFGGTQTAGLYQAAVWAGNQAQTQCDYEIRDNTFTDNDNHLWLAANNCLIKGNTFLKYGYNVDATQVVTLWTLSATGSVGNNTVVDNYFDVDSTQMTYANGFRFRSTDMVSGNHCIDGDSDGKSNGEGRAWYVDSDNGVDTNSGRSWGQAKLTIAAAVALCADYDTIYLRGVTGFAESVVTTPAITNVKIIGVDSTKRRPEWKSAAQGSYALQIRSLDWEVHNIRFSGNLTNTVCLVKVTYDLSTYYGAGVLIKDCYFHGGGDSVGGIEFNGGGFQNDVIGCHFTDFGGVGAAGIWTTNHLNYFLHAKIVGNWFSENVNCLRINAQTCLVKDNVFQTEGAERDATVVCDLVNSGGSGCKGNCCVGNYFGDVTANITSTYGYYGGTGDLWVNETADAKDYGVPT